MVHSGTMVCLVSPGELDVVRGFLEYEGTEVGRVRAGKTMRPL